MGQDGVPTQFAVFPSQIRVPQSEMGSIHKNKTVGKSCHVATRVDMMGQPGGAVTRAERGLLLPAGAYGSR